MIGAIGGDIIGSCFERNAMKNYNFRLFDGASRFTDDTVLTAALADSILSQKDFSLKMKEYFNLYPGVGFGARFINWALSDTPKPYESYGNGSAMRVTPIAWVYDKMEEVLEKAGESAEITHNHPEGIKGAQATAAAVFMARRGDDKRFIKNFIEKTFHYDLSRSLEYIRKDYTFQVSCQKSVPEAIIAFLESKNYEDAVRLAVSLGGDSDTQACIAGGIAEAFYKDIPKLIVSQIYGRLDFRLTKIVKKFVKRYVKYEK